MYKVGDEVVYAKGTPRKCKAVIIDIRDNLLLLDDFGFKFYVEVCNVEPFITPDSIKGRRVKGKTDQVLWKEIGVITNVGLNSVTVLADNKQYWETSIHNLEFVD